MKLPGLFIFGKYAKEFKWNLVLVVVLVLESKVLYWSFSPDVTAWRMFVYKKNPVGFELICMLKLSIIPSNLQSCWPRDWKRSIDVFDTMGKEESLKSHCCFLTFLFRNRRRGRGRPVIPSPFYKGRGVGGWRRWDLSLEFLIYCSISKRFCVILKRLSSS